VTELCCGMLKKKCLSCEKKTDRGFDYCPHCGVSFREKKMEDFGMLGKIDSGEGDGY